MKRIIEVLSYDPEWIKLFEVEAGLLRSIFGQEVAAIHHIGSTSIPGMKAKPIIDILLEVRDIERVDLFNEPMLRLGYEPRGEYGLPHRRYFPKTANGHRTFHIHAWQSGESEIERHLAFRDFMIAHPQQAQAYGSLKEALIDKFAGDKEAYISGKNHFCQEMERQALRWQRSISTSVIESERLRMVPLTAAQLDFLLTRPDQLEAELGFEISGPVAAPPIVRHAIRMKQHRLIISAEKEFAWHTYWLMVIGTDRYGAGLIGFKGVPDKHGEVEIGYGIDPDFRGKGYTTEAACALIDWALRQPECQAVTAWSDKENRASARVLQKVGMTMAKESGNQLCWVRGKDIGG